MILTIGATFGVGVIVTLNSLVAVSPSLSVTRTSNTIMVSTSTSGAIKLTLVVSAFVKVTTGPDTTDQMTIAILPSKSLALAVNVRISNS